MRRLPVVDSVQIEYGLTQHCRARIELLYWNTVVMRRHNNNFVRWDYRAYIPAEHPVSFLSNVTSVLVLVLWMDSSVRKAFWMIRTIFHCSHGRNAWSRPHTHTPNVPPYPETLFSPSYHVLDKVASPIVLALRVTASGSLTSTVVQVLYAANASTVCLHPFFHSVEFSD